MNAKIISGISHTNFNPTINKTSKYEQTNFAELLKSAIENVNAHQIISDRKTEAFASGEKIDLHDVMITAQKASITLETTVQIQKKVIEAYNEVMRMQI